MIIQKGRLKYVRTTVDIPGTTYSFLHIPTHNCGDTQKGARWGGGMFNISSTNMNNNNMNINNDKLCESEYNHEMTLVMARNN